MRTKANNSIVSFFLIALLSVVIFGCKESVLSTKEGDEQSLKALFADVEKIAYQYPCENAGEWKFIAVGSRPCGGASGFIAYSSKVNEQMLFEKIKLFTEKEASYNAKYNPTSPCALIVAPKSVICENGKPKLVY
ncbi:hypothetical protein DHW03_01200 [Pedobacter yonginense]|uniref:Uncharacterized protein n=1 Tax=Pedobacter yonginense TaxID=651869 RepID=A0A317EPF8_9SPHI|nr:hypothetical protein [Pedobacter yonginense]PWS28504.1 hypothetical protein DHW03_01200 [Pedobacter yonginense]